jgi:alpha-tubulin suppressor-like RCC1 family protein
LRFQQVGTIPYSLKNDGTVWACGDNYYGQLGDGTTTDTNTPVQISSLSGIIAVSAGVVHSLFLKNDGTLWACGYNAQGELGDGTDSLRSTPVQVQNLCSVFTGMNENISQKEIFIYPNPTTKSFTIKNIFSNETSLLQLINLMGEIIYTEKLFGKNEYKVDANLPKGIYFVRVNDVVRKLIVE